MNTGIGGTRRSGGATPARYPGAETIFRVIFRSSSGGKGYDNAVWSTVGSMFQGDTTESGGKRLVRIVIQEADQ